MCFAPALRQGPLTAHSPQSWHPPKPPLKWQKKRVRSACAIEMAHVLCSLRVKSPRDVPDPSPSLRSGHGGSSVSLAGTAGPPILFPTVPEFSELSLSVNRDSRLSKNSTARKWKHFAKCKPGFACHSPCNLFKLLYSDHPSVIMWMTDLRLWDSSGPVLQSLARGVCCSWMCYVPCTFTPAVYGAEWAL